MWIQTETSLQNPVSGLAQLCLYGFLYIPKCNKISFNNKFYLGQRQVPWNRPAEIHVHLETHRTDHLGTFVLFVVLSGFSTHAQVLRERYPIAFALSCIMKKWWWIQDTFFVKNSSPSLLWVRDHVEFWGCSNGFNVAGMKAELGFIYRTLEQEKKAAHVHQRDKDGATHKYCKLKECDDIKKGTSLTNQMFIFRVTEGMF